MTLAFLLAVGATTASMCFAPWQGSGHAYGSAEYAHDFLDSATVIVRATVLGPSSDTGSVAEPAPFPEFLQPLAFRVNTILKGSAPLTLLILGQLVPTHPTNEGPFPYDWPRHRGGTCWAFDYTVGREYLLVLRTTRGDRLTPYWASMTLANEQLRDSPDPWLSFVTDHLARTTR
jgi:hypothetical protein